MIALVATPGKPPRSVQGLGLPYLAAALEKGGFEVGIFDLYPSSPDAEDPAVLDRGLADAIAGKQPAIVGMTICTPAYADCVRLARLLRERLPQTLLVAGGHHASAEPGELLRHSAFDVCVIGEGEKTLLEIARSQAVGGRQRRHDRLADIPGVVYKWEQEVRRTDLGPPAGDLDALPFPAHRLLGLDKYAVHPDLGIKSTGILTYRGCPAHCVFCMNPQGHRIRKRSPAQVVREMTGVVREFGVHGFNFYDNLFGLDRGHALAVCEGIIRRRLDVVWDCWTAGDLIDAELARKMREAGCIRVGFGAASGDDRVLFKSQRGFSTVRNRAGIDAITAAGLKVDVLFVPGLPGESAATMRCTVEFAASCGADAVTFSPFRPYPGTAVWKESERFGMQLVCGPSFEAYVESPEFPREEMLAWTQRAAEELTQRGLKAKVLHDDRYAWE